MNIGYVKIEKQKKTNNFFSSLFYKVLYRIHCRCNYVCQDKMYKNVFWINNFSRKSKEKIKKLLEKEKINYAVIENGKEIGYKKIDNNIILKYFLPETLEYLTKNIKFRNKEIYLLVDNYNSTNIDIIKELAQKAKVLNIVTANDSYKNLEKELEGIDIYITVSNNKRKSLKNAEIVINLDMENINNYTINNNMVIIDTNKEALNIPNFFSGKIIRNIKVNTNKVIFCREDLENFSKEDIIKAKILQIKNYQAVRLWVEKSKVYIVNCKK